MPHKNKNAPARLQRLARLVPVSLALFATGCAQNGLQSGSAALNEGLSSSPTTAPPSMNQNSWQPVSGSQQDSAARPKPEVAMIIRQARGLRSEGKKGEALALLDKAPDADSNPALIKERGFLAVELGQVARAKELLTKSQSPDDPDWRVHSALGAALSATGDQKEAQAEFSKGLTLSPENPAILNNLALSLALEGKHDEAERLLRRASVTTQSAPQSRQNLALILGLKGKVDEARKVAAAVLPPDAAKANISYFEGLKAKGTTLSARQESEPSDTVHSVTFASAGSEPIMHLGAKPNK